MERHIKRVLLVILMSTIVFGSMLTSGNKAYAASENKTSGSSKTTKKTASESDIKALMAASEAVLQDYFSEGYSIEREDNLVTISVRLDGVAEGAYKVKTGRVPMKQWTDMKEGMKVFAESAYESYEPYGIHVCVRVLNDTNLDNILLSYLDGIEFYDALAETKIV